MIFSYSNNNDNRNQLNDEVLDIFDINGCNLQNKDYFKKQEYNSKPQNLLKWLIISYCTPFHSFDSFFKSFLSFFPIFNWLPKYSWKTNFIYDLISGLTIGVMFVSQGIAYSYLAGVDPVYGLYSSFFPPLFYIFFGLSPYVSRGPSAVLGVMSGESNEYIQKIYANHLISLNNSLTPENLVFQLPNLITISSTLTFTVGLIQLGMAFIRFEFIANYFNKSLVGGYTTAAAVHVLFPQLAVLMGIPVKKSSGPGYLFVMLTFCLFSFIFDWSTNYNVKVVGEVPRGIPTPSIPRLDLLVYVIPNALAIAVVTLAMHFSMVKLFVDSSHTIDCGQELYAIGFGSVFSSFFPVYPTSTALGRSLVMKESGAKSQICSFISCLFLLAVIFWAGPLFYYLPKSVLSVVVVTALRPVFCKALTVLDLWELSKYDVIIWFVSFGATVITDVINGLCIALFFTLFTVICRTQWPVWSANFSKNMFKFSSTNLKYNNNFLKTFDYCIFYFESYLLFINADCFQKYVEKTLQQWKCIRQKENCNYEALKKDYINKNSFHSVKNRLFIFNFNAISQIDIAGLEALKSSIEKILSEKHAECVYFLNARHDVQDAILNTIKMTNLNGNFFKSVKDAILCFQNSLLLIYENSLEEEST